MSRFLLLIYGDEQKWADASPQWQEENVARHGEFNATNGAAVVGGGELARSRSAVSLRPGPDGRPHPAPGPFVETAHNIGGFYLIEAPDLAQAVRIAGQLPEASSPFSGVEVRPVGEPD